MARTVIDASTSSSAVPYPELKKLKIPAHVSASSASNSAGHAPHGAGVTMHVQRARVWVCAAHLVAWVHRHIVRQRGGVGGIACRHLALRAAERHPRPCGWSMSHAEVSSGSKWWAPAFVIGTVKGASKHQARKNKNVPAPAGYMNRQPASLHQEDQ